MTTIRTRDGWSYAITPGDMVWLGRAAYGEGANPADTIWSWMQRLALPNFRRMSLSELVQRHSQAVNPDWLDGGRFCGPGGQHAGSDACSQTRLVRRERIRASTPDEWPASVRDALAALAAGTLPNAVPRAVDFADATVARSYLERHPEARLIAQRAGGWYIANAESLRWPERFVTIGPGLSLSSWIAIVGLGSAAAVGLGWWLWGRR